MVGNKKLQKKKRQVRPGPLLRSWRMSLRLALPPQSLRSAR
jgi:hypothetical protein